MGDSVTDMITLCAGVLDLPARQIEEARAQTDAAVLSLSQRFAALYGGLETAVKAADAVAGDGALGSVAAYDNSRRTRGEVVESLQRAFRIREASVELVRAVDAERN